MILTDQLSSDVYAALSKNATVVLAATPQTAHGLLIPTASNKFQSCWWLGSPNDNNVGTVIYSNDSTPILAGLDDLGWCDGSCQLAAHD